MKRLLTALIALSLSPMAFAQAAQQPQSIVPTLIMFGGMFVLMYFIIIRPNQKRVKEHQALINSLKVGNEVMLHSGFVGKIVKLGDNFIEVEIAKGVNVRVQRSAIGSLLPNGSYNGTLA